MALLRILFIFMFFTNQPFFPHHYNCIRMNNCLLYLVDLSNLIHELFSILFIYLFLGGFSVNVVRRNCAFQSPFVILALMQTQLWKLSPYIFSAAEIELRRGYMYRNQFRSDRLNDHTTTARRPSHGSGNGTHWVVSGGHGSTGLAARPRSPPYRSRRPSSVQQQYRPRSSAGAPCQGNATSYSPSAGATATGHAPVNQAADACASSESLDNAKLSNVTSQDDILSSISAEGTWTIDLSTPTAPTEVTNKQCTTSSTSSALHGVSGKKHKMDYRGLCDKPHTISSPHAQKMQNQEATNLVFGGGAGLIDKYENVHVSELHEIPMLNYVPPTSKECTDSYKNCTFDAQKYSSTCGNDKSNMINLFDWEERTKNSTEKLEVFGFMHSNSGAEVNKDKCEFEHKRYSRDFLLTFAESCIKLPESFKIGFDISRTVMGVHASASFIYNTELNPNHASIKDRGSTTSQANRHMAGKFDDDKWRKQFFSPVFECNLLSDSINQTTFSSWDALRCGGHGSTRSLSQSQPFSQHGGGMISRAMKEVVSQQNMSHCSFDERWKNRANDQGVSSPYQVPVLPVMHKAKKKYEIGMVSDEEEAKQRQLKAILNKLTPQNFEKLFAQVKELNIDNVVTLTGVISQIFDKALMEPTFCEMYASFCFRLASDLPNFVKNDERITFKRLLLNKCQEEFEKGERESVEADKMEEEDGTKQSKGGREEKQIRARRRMLGNIRLIGELYKKKMLTERIMHECINKLLGEYQDPDEEDLEALCKLMSTIGDMIDHPRAKAHMDFYFDFIKKLSENSKLSSRIRFLLEDVIDLRKNKWRQRRKVEGPKKIEEVRRDAIKQKFGQSTRFGQSSATCISSGLRLGPPDNSLRGSSLLASRGSSKVHTYGSQNVNLNVRYRPSNRALHVSFQQRHTDKSIRLGPHGDFGRGMPLCEKPPPVPNDVLPQVQLNNDHGQITKNSREYSFSGVSSNSINFKASNTSWGMADMSLPLLSTVGQMHRSQVINEPCAEARTFPEEVLQEKSLLTIKEFYNAKDEKEVALCIKELNSPSFYPSVVSLWINDSFERKDIERELLAKLLVYLCKTQEHLLSQRQLLEGFQHVLSTLDDVMTDAPKATMFLGQIFARVILEDVISLTEIGGLLQEQDDREEVARHAVDDSLTSEIMGSMLESIRVERGDSAMDEICAKSNLQCSRRTG
ncbi:hypothetical protein U9M48_033339, partial [Paspalum notatum var. saurae]